MKNVYIYLSVCFFFFWGSCAQTTYIKPNTVLRNVKFTDVADECYLAQIDSLINDAIMRRAFPGCRILAAKNMDVFLDKCYGFVTYDSIDRVLPNTMYDLASITKIAATAPCLMKLDEDGKFNTDNRFSCYSGLFDVDDKDSIKVSELLAHQAGLKSWCNFLPLTFDKSGKPSKQFYSNKKTKEFCYSLTDSIYISKKIKELILLSISNSEIKNRGQYLYSDLSFYIYPDVVERLSGLDFQKYLERQFFRPLGLDSICFNPLNKFPRWRIAPTEFDRYFRNCLIHGRVHDEGAALMGGVSGHAGLFSTARNLAVVMQMFLNGGVYNGHRFLEQTTVDKYTSRVFEGNRRGLCFDKTPLSDTINGTPSKYASEKSFGHTGFTGGFVWADPSNGLLVVFLCNSICPNRSYVLMNLNVRTKLHDILYQAIDRKK